MTAQENIKAIQAHIEAFGKQDIETVKLQCTEDVKWNPPASNGAIPYNRPWEGREGVGQYCRMLIDALEWHSLEIPTLIADDNDNVAMQGYETFTVRATGKRVDNVFMSFFKMREGLIAEFTFCENTELLAAAFKPEA